MLTTDTMKLTAMRGFVRGSWVAEDGTTTSAFARSNQLTYSCAQALARLMAGDITYAPKYMGFIYGLTGTDSVGGSAPSLLHPPTNRDVVMSAGGLGAEMADVVGNIQINPLTFTPSLATDGDSYDSNAITFSAHTRTGAGAVYAFPQSDPYAGPMVAGTYLYHALLLAQPAAGVYVPLARVTLGDAGPVYYAKPSGFELALDWQISFY